MVHLTLIFTAFIFLLIASTLISAMETPPPSPTGAASESIENDKSADRLMIEASIPPESCPSSNTPPESANEAVGRGTDEDSCDHKKTPETLPDASETLPDASETLPDASETLPDASETSPDATKELLDLLGESPNPN